MSDATNPVSPADHAEGAEPAAANTSTQPTGPAPAYTAKTQIGSLGELKEVAPDVYNAMMQGIAQSIVRGMNDHQERLKKMMREARRDAEG